jgi:hypothetical protein
MKLQIALANSVYHRFLAIFIEGRILAEFPTADDRFRRAVRHLNSGDVTTYHRPQTVSIS